MSQATKIHSLTIEGQEIALINGIPVSEKLIKNLSLFSQNPEDYRREIHENITKYAIYRGWVEMRSDQELKFKPEFLADLEFMIDMLDEMEVLASLVNKTEE